MKAAIYSRKSKFTGKGESIENQVTLCKDYAKSIGISENDCTIYEDEGFSGGNTNRPEFQKLLKDAKEKKFDTLICYRLDRISRNIADFSSLIEELIKLGINFVSIREQFDTSTPMGRAMMYIASVFAQLERETIAERVRDNMLELAKSGRWLGGQTPIGFDSESISYFDADFKERKMYKLSPVEAELDTVKLIYDKYIELQSLSQVNKYLLSNNIKTKTGGNWTKSAVQDILTRPAYVKANEEVFEYLQDLGIIVVGTPNNRNGILTYNKKIGKGLFRDMDEWIAAIAKHEGIIEAETWLKIQKLLKTNKEKAPRLGKTNTALLTGILKCGKCSGYMRVSYGKTSAATGEKPFYYTCSLKNDSGKTRCDNANIRGNELEQIVIDKLKAITSDKSMVIEEIKNYKKEISEQNSSKHEIDSINKEISENEAAIDALVTQLTTNPDSAASKYIMINIENRAKQIEILKSKLSDLQSSNKTLMKQELDIDLILKSLDKFSILIDEANYDEKKFLIGSLVDAIYWDGSTGSVEIRLWGTGKKK